MEVNSHTHTARKKWTHYFWEFLMLFVAVFCGFMGENYREHYIDRRAIKHAKNLNDELFADSITMAQTIVKRNNNEKECKYFSDY